MLWRGSSVLMLWSSTLGTCTLPATGRSSHAYLLTWKRKQTSKLCTKVNNELSLLISHTLAAHHDFVLDLQPPQHPEERTEAKQAWVCCALLQSQKALWFCDRCCPKSPVVGSGLMNEASLETRSSTVLAEATITQSWCQLLVFKRQLHRSPQTEMAQQQPSSQTQALLWSQQQNPSR